MIRFDKSTILSLLAAATLIMLAQSCQNTDNDIDQPDEPTAEATLNVTPKYVEFDSPQADERRVTVRCNRDWTFDTDHEWIHGTREGENILVIAVDANQSESPREGSIEVIATPELRHTIEVSQQGLTADTDDPDPDDPDDPDDPMNGDVKVKVVRYSAPTAEKGHEIEYAFDGKEGTYYHSNYNMTPDSFPVEIVCEFDDEIIDYLVYTPSTANESGRWQQVDIEAQCGGSDEWQAVKSHDFGGTAGKVKIVFSETLRQVKGLKFKIGQTRDYTVAVAELEFFMENTSDFDWSTLFTDRSCSELRAGVTGADIDACKNEFYRTIASQMLEGSYPEFRTAVCKPRQHPDRQRYEYKTNAYSLLDNVTGMAVEAGEDIIVLAELNGREASLSVVDYRNGGIDRRQTYGLKSGVNRLTMQSGGLLYVMYHTDDYATAPDVRLNFVQGARVNGYYDRCNPQHAGRWHELLDKAVDIHFDVVGRYAQLAYPTEYLRTHTSDVDDLIRIYDEITYREEVFFGLMRNRNRYEEEMMHNRQMYCISYSDNSESSTVAFVMEYYIGMRNPAAFPDYASDNTLLRGMQCWTIAHELGHSLQVKPFLRWPGMVEITNNIMSQYITRSVFGDISRISVNDGFAEAWNNVFAKEASYNSICIAYSDSAIVPFWQLELYFGNVLGQTPRIGDFVADTDLTDPSRLAADEYAARYDGFYPRLYELIRQFEQQNDGVASGLQYQAQFALLASQAARMDLSDFFTKWGFFKGTGQQPLDEAYADDIRRKIKALGYAAPTDAIEYITDNNWQRFVERRKVNPSGFFSLGDSFHVVIEDETNAVAYEIRDSAQGNKLVAAGEIGFFDRILLPEEWRGTFRVFAVQYDGERVELPQR